MLRNPATRLLLSIRAFNSSSRFPLKFSSSESPLLFSSSHTATKFAKEGYGISAEDQLRLFSDIPGYWKISGSVAPLNCRKDPVKVGVDMLVDEYLKSHSYDKSHLYSLFSFCSSCIAMLEHEGPHIIDYDQLNLTKKFDRLFLDELAKSEFAPLGEIYIDGKAYNQFQDNGFMILIDNKAFINKDLIIVPDSLLSKKDWGVESKLKRFLDSDDYRIFKNFPSVVKKLFLTGVSGDFSQLEIDSINNVLKDEFYKKCPSFRHKVYKNSYSYYDQNGFSVFAKGIDYHSGPTAITILRNALLSKTVCLSIYVGGSDVIYYGKKDKTFCLGFKLGDNFSRERELYHGTTLINGEGYIVPFQLMVSKGGNIPGNS